MGGWGRRAGEAVVVWTKCWQWTWWKPFPWETYPGGRIEELAGGWTQRLLPRQEADRARSPVSDEGVAHTVRLLVGL